VSSLTWRRSLEKVSFAEDERNTTFPKECCGRLLYIEPIRAQGKEGKKVDCRWKALFISCVIAFVDGSPE
jgi:hypothetical protein